MRPGVSVFKWTIKYNEIQSCRLGQSQKTIERVFHVCPARSALLRSSRPRGDSFPRATTRLQLTDTLRICRVLDVICWILDGPFLFECTSSFWLCWENRVCGFSKIFSFWMVYHLSKIDFLYLFKCFNLLSSVKFIFVLECECKYFNIIKFEWAIRIFHYYLDLCNKTLYFMKGSYYIFWLYQTKILNLAIDFYVFFFQKRFFATKKKTIFPAFT